MKAGYKYALIGLGVVSAIAVGIAVVNKLGKDKDKNPKLGGGNGTGGGILGGGSKLAIIGKAVNILPSEQYANVRTSTEVDNIPPDNLLARFWKIKSAIPSYWSTSAYLLLDTNIALDGSPIGTVISTSEGEGGTWYEINLSKPVDGATTGYIREDAVKLG